MYFAQNHIDLKEIEIIIYLDSRNISYFLWKLHEFCAMFKWTQHWTYWLTNA